MRGVSGDERGERWPLGLQRAGGLWWQHHSLEDLLILTSCSFITLTGLRGQGSCGALSGIREVEAAPTPPSQDPQSPFSQGPPPKAQTSGAGSPVAGRRANEAPEDI